MDNYSTDQKRISNLADTLMSYAPDDKAIKACQYFVSRKETNDKEIILELVSAIYNGLAYGNWPWNSTRKELRDNLR